MDINSIIELGKMVALADASFTEKKAIILYCGDYKVTVGVECISIEHMLISNSYASFPMHSVILDTEQEPNGLTAFHFDTRSMSLTIEFTNKAIACSFIESEMVQEENLLETLLQAEG